MKRDFDYAGFEIPDQTRLIMRNFLDKLQNATPDSYVEATVTKSDGSYLLKVTIKFVDGQFSAESRGQDLLDVLNHVAETIRVQIKDWLENRFNDRDSRPTLFN